MKQLVKKQHKTPSQKRFTVWEIHSFSLSPRWPQDSAALWTLMSSSGLLCPLTCNTTKLLLYILCIICPLAAQAVFALLPSESLGSSRCLSFVKQMLKHLKLPSQKCIKQLSFLYLFSDCLISDVVSLVDFT